MTNSDFRLSSPRRLDLGKYWDFNARVIIRLKAEIETNDTLVRVNKEIEKRIDVDVKKNEFETVFENKNVTFSSEEIKNLIQQDNIVSLLVDEINVKVYESGAYQLGSLLTKYDLSIEDEIETVLSPGTYSSAQETHRFVIAIK